MEYDRDLCDERHQTVNRRLDRSEEQDAELHERIDRVITTVNGKFTKLLYTLMGMMFVGLVNLALLVIMLISGQHISHLVHP